MEGDTESWHRASPRMERLRTIAKLENKRNDTERSHRGYDRIDAFSFFFFVPRRMEKSPLSLCVLAMHLLHLKAA